MIPALEIVEPLRILNGGLHGIGQPCTIGRLRVHRKVALPASVAQILGLPSGLANQIDAMPQGASAVVRSLLDAYVQLSWQARIPVSDKVSLERIRLADEWVEFRFVVGCWSIEVTRNLLMWIQAKINDAVQGVSTESKTDSASILASVRPHAFGGVNAFSMVLAALRTGCTVNLLNQQIIVIGTGIHSRWVSSLSTDMTSAMSLKLARNKAETATLLRRAGLPGAVHALVSSVEQALEASVAIGFPVVVKPNDQDQGHGVAAGLEKPEEVASAFSVAATYGPKVLVERHAPGFTHRLTVVLGEVIRVVQRVPGGVTGDGLGSVRDLLLDQQKTSLWRERIRVTGLPGTTLDAEALEMLTRQSLTPESVPASGQFVPLRKRDNFSAGGTNVDLSVADVHPDNLRMAKDAAAMLRLDIAGIDFITTDISRSWITHGGTVCEINGIPQLYAATDDPIYETILGHLFPKGSEVPTLLRLVDDEPTPAQIESAVAEGTGQGVNVVAAMSGLRIDGQLATATFKSGFDAARAALLRRDCRGVICFVTVAEILQRGLPLAKWTHASCSEEFARKWTTLTARDRAALEFMLAGIYIAGLHG